LSDELLILRLTHVVARLGLAMTGAAGATFVAALLMRVELPWFDSFEFTAMLIALGMAGAYLGIDLPGWPSLQKRPMDRSAGIDLVSAAGTFFAAGAGLLALYTFVFDEAADGGWDLVLGFSWALGVFMQIVAGLVSRIFAASAASRY
jgi:hypothetical protein